MIGAAKKLEAARYGSPKNTNNDLNALALAEQLFKPFSELIRAIVRDEVAMTQPEKATSPLATGAATCVALGISMPTLNRRVNEGMPVVRVGNSRRFDLAEVRAWLEARTKTAKAPAQVKRLSRGGQHG